MEKIRRLLFGRAFVALLDQGAVSIASFGTGILLSRAFAGPEREQLGLYYLAFTISILITELQNALVSTPHMVSAPKLKNEELRRFNGSALVHHGVLSGAITLALGLIAWLSPRVGLASHQAMLYACAVTAFAVGLRNFVRFLNFALHRPQVACIADWVVTILQIGGIVGLTKAHDLSAATAVLVIGMASLVGGLVALAMSMRDLSPHMGRAWEDFRDNWRLSRWVCASGIVWNVGTSLYPWIIDTLSGTLQAAVWGNCNTISSLGNPLLMGLQNWSAPAVAHAYADRPVGQFRRFVIRVAAMFMVMIPPMMLVAGVISNPLLHRVYHDPTPGTRLLVVVLSAGWLVQSMSFVISRGLFSLGRGDLDLWANLVPIGVLMVAGYSLIHRYGATGGAWCLLASFFLSMVVRAGMFLKITSGARRTEETIDEGMAAIVPAEAM